MDTCAIVYYQLCLLSLFFPSFIGMVVGMGNSNDLLVSKGTSLTQPSIPGLINLGQVAGLVVLETCPKSQ